jgi:pimeloyl-ACP methyl ester carboxylesterase
MSSPGPHAAQRRALAVHGTELSYLHAGEERSRAAVLLHGTWWSRVWEPVLPALGVEREVFALDLPGFGRSGGQLTRERADVPSLARWVVRFAEAAGIAEPFAVVGHDIGGAVAQHLAVHEPARVERLALVNTVLYDSWPVPAVARFRDPAVAAETTLAEFLAARGTALDKGVARPLEPDVREAYLAPFASEARMRSWMAMAAAADARFTLELVPALRERALPTLLVWGVEDGFQPVAYAERFAAEMPDARLVRVDRARHLPMEDRPEVVTDALGAFLRAR